MTGNTRSFDAARFRQRAAKLLEEARTAGPDLAPQLERLAAEYNDLADEFDRLAGHDPGPD